MYRLVGRKDIRRQGEIISPGDVFEPTDAELRSFGDKLEKVESDKAHDEPEESDETETDTVDTVDSDETDKPTCAGKDGACSRDVPAEGMYCWQHSEDEDEDE